MISYKYFVIPVLHFLIIGPSLKAQSHSIADQPWPESLGNHRALLAVDQMAPAVTVDLVWRRHDKNPEERRFIIVHEESGDTISNIHRIVVSNERCQLIFGPVKKSGIYYFYYLPHVVQEEYGFYNKPYPGPESPPSNQWVAENQLDDSSQWPTLSQAQVVEIQARTAFDSFFPMEVIALQSEKDVLHSNHQDDYLLFPEYREYPIRMLDEIPLRWIEKGPSLRFTGKAQKNEYYAFQVGMYAARKGIHDVRVVFQDLKARDHRISASKLTCFNTGGVDPYGNNFKKRIDILQGNVQPLWIGIDVPANIQVGTYVGRLSIVAENADTQEVAIHLEISDEFLADRGDHEPWRHSRLRWLNSRSGLNDQPTKRYQPIVSKDERTFELSGKRISLDEHLLPKSMEVYGHEILQQPTSFVIETENGHQEFSPAEKIKHLKDAPGLRHTSWQSHTQDLHLTAEGTLEADGFLNYKITIAAKIDINLVDVRLEMPMKSNAAQYLMGMGLPGTTVPKQHEAGWEGPYDSFWIGSVDGGLWCELRGGSYHGPLLNLYRPSFPASWHNGGKGGFRILKEKNLTTAIAFSGAHRLTEGDRLEFEWSWLITPVKEIDSRSQFMDRYFHNAWEPIPPDEDIDRGIRVVNLHHGNEFNPHINYPFIAVDEMKDFVHQMHEKGQKVKIYYTVRELTNYATELWALRSLGDEILGDGNGGGYPWLQEHLVGNYRPQWYQYFPDKSADASIVNAPGESRWYNYYIEGLAWLVRNVDIDGLYLDDVTYDRRILKRIRKVLDQEKPDCLIDLHSNTGFSKGPATQYAEFFPFIDKLWFGESFKYDEMSPANWLVEVSGIPFGHMGDMLHGGGNRWLGMLFGMTVRHPWLTEGVTCDPRPIWSIWDDFNIEEAEMFGFWEDKPLVETDHPGTFATAYLRENQMLIALGNWHDENVSIGLRINWGALGVSPPNQIKLIVPAIQDFQNEKTFALDDSIPIAAKKGLLLKLNF